MAFFEHLPSELWKLNNGSTPLGLRSSIPFSMTQSSAQLATNESPLWFCLKTQPKHEHIAATTLRRHLNIDCFAPRVRFKKATRRGAVWFVEPMFPGYVFAEFVYPAHHRRVQHSPGVQCLVHFGDYVATLAPEVVALLRKKAGDEEIVTFDPEIQVGQPVQITEGPFQGLEALVTRLVPARERIRVLLEFLGRTVETEIPRPQVLPLTQARR